MMLRRTLPALAAAAAITPAGANEFRPMLEDLARSEMQQVLSDPALLAALRAQNARTAGLSEDEILALDADWRSQVGRGEAPLIEAVTGNDAAANLRARQEEAGGLFSEIFVMDSRGLNVAASNTTSDYWQGDEAKWQESFGLGAGAMHIGEIEFDESSQSYLSQVSLTVTDPETGEPIGAATFGVNVEMLP
jgi:hypothetical protein